MAPRGGRLAAPGDAAWVVAVAGAPAPTTPMPSERSLLAGDSMEVRRFRVWTGAGEGPEGRPGGRVAGRGGVPTGGKAAAAAAARSPTAGGRGGIPEFPVAHCPGRMGLAAPAVEVVGPALPAAGAVVPGCSLRRLPEGPPCEERRCRCRCGAVDKPSLLLLLLLPSLWLSLSLVELSSSVWPAAARAALAVACDCCPSAVARGLAPAGGICGRCSCCCSSPLVGDSV